MLHSVRTDMTIATSNASKVIVNLTVHWICISVLQTGTDFFVLCFFFIKLNRKKIVPLKSLS